MNRPEDQATAPVGGARIAAQVEAIRRLKSAEAALRAATELAASTSLDSEVDGRGVVGVVTLDGVPVSDPSVRRSLSRGLMAGLLTTAQEFRDSVWRDALASGLTEAEIADRVADAAHATIESAPAGVKLFDRADGMEP